MSRIDIFDIEKFGDDDKKSTKQEKQPDVLIKTQELMLIDRLSIFHLFQISFGEVHDKCEAHREKPEKSPEDHYLIQFRPLTVALLKEEWPDLDSRGTGLGKTRDERVSTVHPDPRDKRFKEYRKW